MSDFLESRDDAKFTYEIVLIPPLPCPVVMLKNMTLQCDIVAIESWDGDRLCTAGFKWQVS